jgi:methionine sulfoxide reductase heme-binding subunit
MKSFFKPAVFVLCLLPASYIFYAVYLAYNGENILGPDPPKALSLETGTWAIRMLVLSLAITPIRYLFNTVVVWQYRRMIGLYAFFYATLHLLVFLWFLLEWRWRDIGIEIAERPFITIGFAAYVLMVPLAMTSFNYAQRKLGRNWKRIHRSIYVISILAVLHVIWIVRSSYGDAVLYGGLVLLFLGYRLLRHYSQAVKRFSFRPPPPKIIRS